MRPGWGRTQAIKKVLNSRQKRGGFASIIRFMEISKWKPTEEEREVMEAVWMQVKGACEKLKEETSAQDEHIRMMLQEMADRYYS